MHRVRQTIVTEHRNPVPSDTDASRRQGSNLKSLATKLKQGSPVSPSALPRLRRRPWHYSRDIWVPSIALVGFSATAFLVFAAEPTNFLLTFDHSVQEWIVSTIPPWMRDSVFAKGISNIFIVFDLVVGSSLILIQGLGKQNKQWAMTGFTALFFFAGVGSHTYEGWIVHSLKQTFHRCRPQPGMISYSFPSGHVTSAVFLTGALLFVWLPIAIQSIDEDTPPVIRVYVESLRWMLESKMLLWGLSFLCTAMGRVGGNVHWVSDTLAGGFLGIALTSLLVLLQTALTVYRKA